jgi:hypothetical protein
MPVNPGRQVLLALRDRPDRQVPQARMERPAQQPT